MAEFIRINQVALANKRVLMRVDMNVPLRHGVISDDQRIRACLADIRQVLEAGAAVILISHLGRPSAGRSEPQFSLQPVATRLSELLQQPVSLKTDYLEGVELQPQEIVLCENIRFQIGELEDDDSLARKLARLCDVFVMDAFGCAHRAHASTHKVIEHAPIACAGALLECEVNEIQHALGDHASEQYRQRVAIIGGAKVSGKLELLSSLSEKMDTLIVGGGIANTFIAGMGYDVGKSLYEKELVSFSCELREKMKSSGKSLLLPSDVVCASDLSEQADVRCKSLAKIAAAEQVLDIGPQTRATFSRAINAADCILWNGPVGAFECAPFAEGTKAIAQAVEQTAAHTVAGGGDTLAAIKQFKVSRNDLYLSTGGGAFLALAAGQELPALTALAKAKSRADPNQLKASS